MTVAWPTGITQNAVSGSVREQQQRNVFSFEPDAGVPIERRKSSIAMSTLSFISIVSRSQKALLETFYRTDLSDGVLAFTRKHPRTGSTITCKFSSAPEFSDLASGYHQVQIQLQVMP